MRRMIDCACPFNLPLASGDSGLRATVTYPEDLLQRSQFCDHNQSYLSPSAGDPRPREADCAPHGQREKACRLSSGAEQTGGASQDEGRKGKEQTESIRIHMGNTAAECKHVRDAAHIPVCSIEVPPDVCAA